MDFDKGPIHQSRFLWLLHNWSPFPPVLTKPLTRFRSPQTGLHSLEFNIAGIIAHVPCWGKFLHSAEVCRDSLLLLCVNSSLLFATEKEFTAEFTQHTSLINLWAGLWVLSSLGLLKCSCYKQSWTSLCTRNSFISLGWIPGIRMSGSWGHL